VNKSTTDAKDRIAQKASATLADKLKKAIGAAEKEMHKYDSLVELLTDPSELDEKKEALKAMYDGKEADLRGITTAESWDASKKDYQALVASIPKAVKDYVAAVKQAEKKKGVPLTEDAKVAPVPAKPTEPNTRIHNAILKDTRETIAKTEKNAKKLDSTIKDIENALKVIPKPEIFAGGCFVATVAARQTLDILGSAYSRLSGHLSELKDAFETYKKETNGIKTVLDSSFEYTPSELRSMEEKRAAEEAQKDAEQAKKDAEQAARVDDARLKIEVITKALKQKRRLIAAWDDLQARGIPPPPPPGAVFPGIPPPPPPPPSGEEGAQAGGGFEILRKLKQRIDTAIVGVRKEMIPLAGLVFDSEPLLRALKAVPQQDTLTPEEQAEEAKFCKGVVEEDEKELPKLPEGVGTTGDVVTAVNPMFSAEQAAKAEASLGAKAAKASIPGSMTPTGPAPATAMSRAPNIDALFESPEVKKALFEGSQDSTGPGRAGIAMSVAISEAISPEKVPALLNGWIEYAASDMWEGGDGAAKAFTNALAIVIPKLPQGKGKVTAEAIRDEIPAALARYKTKTPDPGSAANSGPPTPLPAADTPSRMYTPNPLRRPNQLSASEASQRFMVPAARGGKKTRRKGGRGSRKSRKSTLKKRRGGK
jgi:hypothetical protein